MRRILAVAFLVAAIVAWPSLAHAVHTTDGADVSTSEAVGELEHARALIDDAVALYRAGDVDAAYTAARNAYLDHFEYVEIPLRVRDGGLTLEVEEDFAALR
ncbi:MAG: hypothetical protein M3277_09055, partial [Actinomycetota bacterium]|nr:hypothetical protein [Actinomycetota bacterium]